MKKFVSMLLVIVMLVSLCACGKPKLSGKYYWESSSDIYYEFDGKNNGLLYGEGIGYVNYVYTVSNETYEGLDGIYIVHLSDTNSSAGHKVVWDSNVDSIWDPDVGSFYKK